MEIGIDDGSKVLSYDCKCKLIFIVNFILVPMIK